MVSQLFQTVPAECSVPAVTVLQQVSQEWMAVGSVFVAERMPEGVGTGQALHHCCRSSAEWGIGDELLIDGVCKIDLCVPLSFYHPECMCGW